jgi:predicted phosphodiesterase
MACTGDYDLVCCGHSHVAEVRQQPNILGGLTWLVNPGTVAGLGAPTATWIMGRPGDRWSSKSASLPGAGTPA